MPGTEIEYEQVALALVLVAVAIGLSFWQRARVEGELLVATVRAFVQLIALGFVLEAIFDSDSAPGTIAILGAMVLFGAVTGRSRAAGVPAALPILAIALGVAAAATLGLVLALDVIDASARTLVPLGGMVIGNAMTAAATALYRLGDELRGSAAEIEARLSLGATSQQAARPVVRRSLRTGLIAQVDSTKSAGLVFIPGTMVGMLLAGADPFEAVRLQLVIFYVLLGGVAIAAVIATSLAANRFFTPAHQLRDLA